MLVSSLLMRLLDGQKMARVSCLVCCGAETSSSLTDQSYPVMLKAPQARESDTKEQ